MTDKITEDLSELKVSHSEVETIDEDIIDTKEKKDKKKERDRPISIKCALIGESQIGKTSFMVRYAKNVFDLEYIQTIGVNSMDKKIKVGTQDVIISLWDLGAQKEFETMMPIVLEDALIIFYMFDLSRPETFYGVKEQFRINQITNPTSHPFIIGTKYDLYIDLNHDDQNVLDKLLKKMGKMMNAPIIFTSSSHSINIKKVFKVVLARYFNLKCGVPEVKTVGEALLIHSYPIVIPV